MIQRFIERGALVDAQCQLGRTPLIEAARLGEDTKVQLLTEAGASVDIIDYTGYSALSHAVRSR
jgi:ankyrin repeat protein